MTDRYFNLVEEPWIPVILLDGEAKEASLRDLFQDLTKIRTIASDLATMDGALLRMLLAIVYSAYREVDGKNVLKLFEFEDWEEAWEEPDSLTETVEKYLDRMIDRFWLFDPEAPFMQVADLETKSGNKDSIAKIIAEIPDGEPFMVMRSGEGVDSTSIAEAARWLVHCHAYDTSGIKSGALGDPRVKGGKGYPIGTGWCGQLGLIWVEAENLHQTILRNLVPVDLFGEFQLEYPDPTADLAPWERTPDTSRQRGSDGAGEAPINGIVELLTWQSRRIRLFRDGSEARSVLLAQGDKIVPQNKQRLEMMSTWRYSTPQSKKFKTDVYMPKMHDPSVALWRGLESVLIGTSPRLTGEVGGRVPAYLPSAVIKWNELLALEGFVGLNEVNPVHGVGFEYGPQSSSYVELFNDRVLLPGNLLFKESVRRLVVESLATTDEVVTAISYFAENVLKAATVSISKDQASHGRAKEKQVAYFILDELFRDWLVTIGDDEMAARKQWARQLGILAQTREDEISRSVSTSAYLGNENMSLGKAQIFLRASVSKILMAYQGGDNDEQ